MTVEELRRDLADWPASARIVLPFNSHGEAMVVNRTKLSAAVIFEEGHVLLCEDGPSRVVVMETGEL
jgi:hypothetical protein